MKRRTKTAIIGGAAVLLAVVTLYAGWLCWRVVDQRAKAAPIVAAILADADPAIETISDGRIALLLRVEDPTFWDNDGIDLHTAGAGMTTLSQGLGKLIFFRPFRAGFLRLGKLELMVLTRFALVPTVSKEDILRAMLARAYLGSDEDGAVLGFPEAARRWFGKEIGDLTNEEFLALVAMLPAAAPPEGSCSPSRPIPSMVTAGSRTAAPTASRASRTAAGRPYQFARPWRIAVSSVRADSRSPGAPSSAAASRPGCSLPGQPFAIRAIRSRSPRSRAPASGPIS
jgi:hypothetical protein